MEPLAGLEQSLACSQLLLAEQALAAVRAGAEVAAVAQEPVVLNCDLIATYEIRARNLANRPEPHCQQVLLTTEELLHSLRRIPADQRAHWAKVSTSFNRGYFVLLATEGGEALGCIPYENSPNI